MLASECVPYVKVGGLGDAVGGLSKALRAAGHEVLVVVPKYAAIDTARWGLRSTVAPLGVWMGNREEWCAAHQTVHDEVPCWFIESEKYFGRPGVYHDREFRDYGDNARRFGFLCRAGLQLLRALGFAADVVHAHDWPTAAAAAYLKVWHWDDATLGRTASILTIHNAAHQGIYGAEAYAYLGLQPGNFSPGRFEDHGRINLLKGGIAFADALNAVSPTYARETLGPIGGNGLGPYLAARGDRYTGILNGVDYDEWDPAVDRRIPARFTREDLSGKAECKRELQRRMNLEADPAIPLVASVCRFVDQKGMDLVAQAIDGILDQMRVQFAVLGSGEKGLESFFAKLPERRPGRAASWIGYDEDLAHWIEAGADFFLMPSRFEPCGLNQIYSLRYGTPPIARATGGLNDTVEQYDERTGTGTGFKFDALTPRAVHDTVGWAVSTFYDRPEHLQHMRREGMSREFSWARTAREYEALYERARARRP
ncbi:MAG: glycogen synthase [Deltaproteobacteria bacterium]|nr:glycogen synthase [Deltaproteobacteria bacterium]